MTNNANYRLAASPSVFDRGSGAARHTPLIAERRAAMDREAHVFDSGSGAARHTPLIAERRAAMDREAHVFDSGSGVARHTPLLAEKPQRKTHVNGREALDA